MPKLLLIFLSFLITKTLLAQSPDSLLSEEVLLKKPIYTNLMQAFSQREQVYRVRLQGTGGYYGKINAIHPEIDSLYQLQYFHVINQDLENLPLSFGNLSNLQQLYLSGNKFKSIPDTIFSLGHLKRLDFRANQLRSIPPEIAQLKNLEFLYLADNPNLEKIPLEAILRLKNLKFLNLKGTRIDRGVLAEIAKKMPQTQVSF